MSRMNLPGIIAGLLTIVLPFIGAWWQLTLGTDAVIVYAAPFEVKTVIFGETMVSPFFWWFCLGLKLGVMYVGVVLLAGSVFTGSNRHTAIAEELVRFGSSKLMYLVVMFVAGLIIMTLLANQSSGIVPFRLHLPYLVGSEVVEVSIEQMRVTIPISMKLRWSFAVAVLAAALGIYSRIYQKTQIMD